MALPLKPPLKPQLAKSRKELPEGEGWAYEPKWDGYRAIVFVDGGDVTIQSRSGKPLGRYFPEVGFPKGRYVMDGELVVQGDGGREDFDLLQQRIHPAESRIKKLSEETPATYVAFDLLALGKEKWLKRPFSERRERLEKEVSDPIQLTPCVTEDEKAREWLLVTEGVIAKELDAPYLPGERRGMVKVKRQRTIDCVVVGWRPGKEEGTVGSLILGLYEDGELQVVGHTSGFRAKEKRELVKKLGPYETGERGSGDPSRWASERDLEWIELRPELVVEVSFDQAGPRRIRHGAKLLRWRDDRDARSCKFEQLAG
jgi:ATP-dependent DNA ligase